MGKMIDEYNKGAKGEKPSSVFNEKSFFGLFTLKYFKIAFLVILSIWFLRLGINYSVSPIPFSEFLNMLKNCPNYYNNIVNSLKSSIIYNGSTDSFNLPIIGGFLNFLGNVWNILVYVCGAIVSALGYLLWIFSSVFV